MEIEDQPARTIDSVYLRGKYVAHGSFGQVCQGVSRSDPSKIVAIKEVDKRRFQGPKVEILLKTLQRQTEYNLKLKQTNCPYIVEFIEWFDAESTVYFVFQYCEMTLSDLMAKYSEPQYFAKREYILLKILYEMLLTLKVLEQHNLIHRDIKPDNILICGGVSKMADFGFCREIDEKLTSGRGSLRTTAPESHTSTFYNKCDIWSLGVSIHNCLYGVEPFSQKMRGIQDPYLFREAITSKSFEVEMRKESRISEILERMIVIEESERADVGNLLQHPLFKVETFNTSADWIRGWLVYSSYSLLNNRYLDNTILAIVGVAFSESKVYYQLHKTKGKHISFFALMFIILQLFVHVLTEINAVSDENATFIQALGKFYDQGFIEATIKALKSSHKSIADGIEKLYKLLLSGAEITPRLVQLCSLCSGKESDEAVNLAIQSKYPSFSIFPTLIKIIKKMDKLNWSLNNIIALASKEPLLSPKFYFNERSEYHDHISIF